MCSKMKDLVGTHLGYTALANELTRCFRSILFIFRRANRLVGGSTIYLQSRTADKFHVVVFRSDTWGQ